MNSFNSTSMGLPTFSMTPKGGVSVCVWIWCAKSSGARVLCALRNEKCFLEDNFDCATIEGTWRQLHFRFLISALKNQKWHDNTTKLPFSDFLFYFCSFLHALSFLVSFCAALGMHWVPTNKLKLSSALCMHNRFHLHLRLKCKTTGG